MERKITAYIFYEQGNDVASKEYDKAVSLLRQLPSATVHDCGAATDTCGVFASINVASFGTMRMIKLSEIERFVLSQKEKERL